MNIKKERTNEYNNTKPKKIFNIYKYLKNNVIRKVSNYLYDNFNLKDFKIKKMYILIHGLLIFLVGFIFMFNCNILHLIIVLIIVSLDAFSIVVLHNCPLTLMEKKYLKHSSNDIQKKCLKNLGISYNCDHIYENQIELLINIWMLIAGKCLIILFLKTTNIRLTNYYNLYG